MKKFLKKHTKSMAKIGLIFAIGCAGGVIGAKMGMKICKVDINLVSSSGDIIKKLN